MGQANEPEQLNQERAMAKLESMEQTLIEIKGDIHKVFQTLLGDGTIIGVTEQLRSAMKEIEDLKKKLEWSRNMIHGIVGTIGASLFAGGIMFVVRLFT